MDYNAAIAQAAREYRAAKADDALDRTEESAKAKSLAYDKLCYMIAAEKHGWNPADYKPED